MCPTCERPQSACICGLAAHVQGTTELLILQHPMEAGHAKGSARLLQLSVAGARMLRGEVFDNLEAILHEGGKAPILLFPETEGGAVEATTLSLSSPRLVVLDGTWRKCRKMLYLNPVLAALPRLALKSPPTTRYRIRKAQGVDQLSTLEATCHALAQLEGAPDRYRPVLDAFDRLVEAHESLESKGRAA